MMRVSKTYETRVEMSGVIWYWTKGNINIYTRRIDIVDKAMQDGEFVVTLENKPHIFGISQLYINPQFQ